MALPILNENPNYSMVIPSIQKEVRFRPFLVKEQKVLMIAQESNDRKQMLRAMVDTIKSCVDEEIDFDSLATFDVDYCFTQLRSKSVGEKATLTMNCEECQTPNDFEINLDQIEPPRTNNKNLIELTPDINIKMRYPSYIDFITNETISEGKAQTEIIMEFIMLCIDSILTKDEQIRLKDESREEIVRFIESLNSKQFQKLSDFVQEIPKLSYDIEVPCSKCNHKTKTKLEGLESFL